MAPRRDDARLGVLKEGVALAGRVGRLEVANIWYIVVNPVLAN